MPQPLAKRRLRRIPFIRTTKPAGTAPGTLTVDVEAPRPVMTVIAYGPDDHVRKVVDDPDELPALMERWPVVWINVDGLGDVDVLTRLGAIFDIHRLALEDVAHVHQRAKVEPYEDHLFIVARMVHAGEAVETEQISVFLGRHYVLSFQERAGDCFDLVRQRIVSGRGRIRRAGAGYLGYALIDALIDAYFPVLERYSEILERLEAEVLADPGHETLGRVHGVRRDLLAIRRAIWPHREAINTLIRDESPLISDETRVHLRDCYDHAIQLIDMVETYRELGSGLTDLYLSGISNRMNEVMKVLTMFAAIFIPLSFMAGVYGMNFDTASSWNMPELAWPYGYPMLLAAMIAVAAGLLLFFRHKGWIGRGRARRRRGDDVR